jgi:FPC/CPF motif-containing protein YcgG
MLDQNNPFNDEIALANSNYCRFDGRHLIRPVLGGRSAPLTEFVHDALRGLVLNEHFTCDGGKAAVRRGNYGFGLYDTLGAHGAASGLARDLFTFITHETQVRSGFSTYLASFSAPHPKDEAEFEGLLWETLQRLHDVDVSHHEWDGSVSADPTNAHFSFSFAGIALFVIGLHAGSSRASRRFAWPTLVFNPHQQFDDLKQSGRYPRFQQVVRRAELALQGSLNPMLADHGERSEASQYSGRRVDDEWKCPFHARNSNEPAED